ncbi:MAG: glucose-1-phosphate thymidylyltransferase RfbA [Legionellaceae bacterium]|nr:glucose-1-phosphate thymidylyltransferase RfbA [Legionellaceae bacterium]MBP9774319.1 glucose-1-phosphate thymidylyltransferase RfbA [Legionellaceae bacterium]
MTKRKGIILAGGLGTRLRPMTLPISKHLLHVYDKPMIYYSLSLLMFAGIREILLISTKHDLNTYRRLLGDGQDWGLTIDYQIQEEPAGIAQAFILGEQFIGDAAVSLVLGDNILYGDGLPTLLGSAAMQTEGATIFGSIVRDPQRYGIISFSEDGKVLDIEEKPQNPQSNYAAIGLYFYDNKVVEYAKSLRPSKRGELEITDINRMYLQTDQLNVRVLGRGMAWFDAGTAKSLLDASNYFYSLEDRQGLKACCPEEIAWRANYIDEVTLNKLAKKIGSNEYGSYLMSLIEKKSIPHLPLLHKEEFV